MSITSLQMTACSSSCPAGPLSILGNIENPPQNAVVVGATRVVGHDAPCRSTDLEYHPKRGSST